MASLTPLPSATGARRRRAAVRRLSCSASGGSLSHRPAWAKSASGRAASGVRSTARAPATAPSFMGGGRRCRRRTPPRAPWPAPGCAYSTCPPRRLSLTIIAVPTLASVWTGVNPCGGRRGNGWAGLCARRCDARSLSVLLKGESADDERAHLGDALEIAIDGRNAHAMVQRGFGDEKVGDRSAVPHAVVMR